MLCHDHIDWSMSAVSAGTWHMATNAVGDATHVTKSAHKSAHTVQADAHAVVALEDITSTTCNKKNTIGLQSPKPSMYCHDEYTTVHTTRSTDVRCSKT